MELLERIYKRLLAHTDTNLLSADHSVWFAKDGDFIVDGRYLFEVGGKGKGFAQIRNIPDSFVVADDIDLGFGNKIPLWLFGFLYRLCSGQKSEVFPLHISSARRADIMHKPRAEA